MLLAGWIIVLASAVGISVWLVICFCDPREKKSAESKSQGLGNNSSHEEDYVLDANDSMRLDADATPAQGSPSNTRAMPGRHAR